MENTNPSPFERIRGWMGRSCLLGALLLLAGAAFGFHSAQMTGETAALEAHGTMEIFRNNAGMLGWNLLGMLLLGLPNMVSGAMNGYALGSAAAISLRQYGAAWMVRAFLPHAILELPVIVVSVSLGFLPWMLIGLRIRQPEHARRPLLAALGKAVIGIAAACVALLLIAAWIEANISMRVAL